MLRSVSPRLAVKRSDLYSFLVSTGDERLAALFASHDVHRVVDLRALESEDYVAMGISIGARSRIRRALTDMPSNSVWASPLPPPASAVALPPRGSVAWPRSPRAEGGTSAAGAPAYASLVESDTGLPRDDRELPARRVLIGLDRLAKVKSLLLFGLFYITTVSLATVRMDWWMGHETLGWLHEAHETVHVPEVQDAEDVADIAAYLDGNLALVVAQLKSLCPHCEVGITPKPQDMTFLGLDDFVCSDFDSTIGWSHYPSRDCQLENAQWAKEPSPLSAPCCDNATLVRASVAMMTEHIAYNLLTLPLYTLLNGGSDPSYSSTEYFVRFYVEHYNFVLQLIVSRFQRMAATEFHVADIRKDAPTLLTPIPTYWSFNYANQDAQSLLRALMVFTAVLVLMHDRRKLWVFWERPPEQRASERHDEHSERADGGGGSSSSSSSRRQNSAMTALRRRVTSCQHALLVNDIMLRQLKEPYVAFIELPSVGLPVLLELVRPYLELPNWSFWVVLTEMVLSVRLLHEGTLVRPLKRMVRVIDAATPNLMALVVVLVPLSLLTSLMHSQLFGLFDDGFSDPFISFSRVINMLTAPPPPENTEGTIIEAQKSGSEVLFYWSTVVIRLCFGSFIVAILVGAYNNVVTKEEKEVGHIERDESLPLEYVDCSRASIGRALCVFSEYVAFTSLYGLRGPRLVRFLEEHIAMAEIEGGARAKEGQIMIGASELSELLGDEPAHRLLDAYGARPLRGNEKFDA